MPRLTLTFDNGPTPGVTEPVLDVLATHHVPAVFFVIGEKVRSAAGRALAARAVATGHLVGNHTLTHTVPLGRLEATGDLAAVEHEIDEAQSLLGGLAGEDPAPVRLFRPYGAGGVIGDGLIGPHGRAHLAHRGLTGVTWNSVPGDWYDPDGWVERALDAVDAHEHAVVVLHDVPGACLARLDEFLDACGERGVEWRQDFPAGCAL